MRAVFGLSAALLLAAPLAAQDVEWVEVRFYRVHLKNGNFIDGQLTSQSERQVVLKMKVGEMGIRRDLIDRVEFVKIRSLNEKPKPVEARAVKTTPKPAVAGAEKPETPSDASAARVTAPEAAPRDAAPKDKVQQVLERFRTVRPENKYDLVAELMKTEGATAEHLAKLLATSDAEMRFHLVEVLSIMKEKEAVPTLREHLASPDAALRASAAELIGQVGDAGVVDDLKPLLKDNEPSVRIAALVALQTLGDRRTFEDVAELTLDKEQGVRNRAINALFDIARKHELMKDAVETLSRALDRARGDARCDLIRGIGRAGQKEAWRTLSDYLRDGDARVRSATAEALGVLGALEAKNSILSQLPTEGDKKTRITLGIAAARMKILESIPVFIGWLAESDPDFNTAAQHHLRTLTGQNFGPDMAKWSAWWEQARPK
jgi:hypothetical protein